MLDRGQIVQPIADCNRNGIADAQDLALGTSSDCNGNGYPDECEVAPCPQRTFFVDYGSNPADLQVVKVTEANLTYVAIDKDGRPRSIPTS